MELAEIEAFVAIAQGQSFTAAAAKLFVTQPAVSRRIELIEQELDIRLFDRIRGGVRLTDAGERFLPYALQTLAAVRDGTAAVKDLDGGELGSVRLAIVGTLASTVLTRRLKQFRQSNPNIRVTIQTARSVEVSRQVSAGDATLGLRYFADTSPALVSELISTEELVVVSAADTILIRSQIEASSELNGLPWVGYPLRPGSSGEAFTALLNQQLVRAGIAPGEMIYIDSLTAQKRMIEADFGLGLIQRSAIEEELALGTLSIVDAPDLATTVPIYSVRRRDGYLSGAARRLLEELSRT